MERDSNRFPAVLVLMAFMASYPVRFRLMGTSASIFDLALLPLAYICLLRRILGNEVDWGPPLVVGALIAQWLAATLSLFWTRDLEGSLTTVLVALASLLTYLLVQEFSSGIEPIWIARAAGIFAVLLIAISLATFLQLPGFAPPAEAEDPWGWLWRLSHPLIGKSNNLATILVTLAPILLVAGRMLDSWFVRIAGLAAVVGALLTFSRGALLSMVIMIIVWILTFPRAFFSRKLSARRRFAWILASAAAISAAYLGVHLFLNEVIARGLVLTSRASLQDGAREELLKQGVGSLAQRPLLGQGPGVDSIDLHNTYLQALVDYGIVLGAIVVASLFAVAVPWFGPPRANGSEELRKAIGTSMVGMLIMCGVESSYEGNLLRQLIWFALGLGIALHTSTKRASVRLNVPRSANLRVSRLT